MSFSPVEASAFSVITLWLIPVNEIAALRVPHIKKEIIVNIIVLIGRRFNVATKYLSYKDNIINPQITAYDANFAILYKNSQKTSQSYHKKECRIKQALYKYIF